MSKTITSTPTVYGPRDYPYFEGDKIWYTEDGVIHREDGPAVEYADGSTEWYFNGKFHREDGPAVDLVYGFKAWCKNGLRHREDGPAIEFPNGHKAWYIDNIRLTEEEFNNRNKVELTMEDIAKLAGVSVDKIRIKG